MVKYEEAIRKPFTDFKKLLIGIVLAMVPIVNFTVAKGFAIESSGLSKTKKSKNMPDWKRWFHLFKQGLAAFLIDVIYLIPAFLVMSIGIGLVVGDVVGLLIETIATPELVSQVRAGAVTSSEAKEMVRATIRGNWYAVLPTIIKAAPIMLAGLFLGIVAVFLSPIAVLNYAKKKKFSAAFDLSTVIRKALSSKYILAWASVIILTVILGAVIGLIPFFGKAIVLFVMWVIAYSLYGDVYREVK